MKLELAHLLQPRVLVEFAQDNLWDRLPWALLALGVIFGGFLVIWAIRLLLSYFFIPKYRERYVLIREEKSGKKYFAPTRRMRWGSFVHLILETFFIVSIVIVLWIAAHIAGFNFWTSTIVLGFIGSAGVYIFGGGLQNFGSGFIVFLTDKVEEGWYISVCAYKGRVIEIHPLYVEIETRDEKTGGAIHHQIPMLLMLTTVVSRFYYEEYCAPILTRKDDPTSHLTGDESDILIDMGGIKEAQPAPLSEQVGYEVLDAQWNGVHQRPGVGGTLSEYSGRGATAKIEHQPYQQKRKKGQ